MLKISLELLYHYSCGHCNKWWSIADIKPIPGSVVTCPHCNVLHLVPDKVLTGEDFVKEGDRNA